MPDGLHAWMTEQGMGEPDEIISLNGSLTLGSGLVAAHLVRSPSGVWIAAANAVEGRAIQIDPQSGVTYVRRRVRDGLHTPEGDFTVPLGSAHAARLCIALGRLGPGGELAVPMGPLIEGSLDTVAMAWLSGWLTENELVLAWLDAKTKTTVPSPLVGADETRPWTWVLTDRRCVLVAFTDLGDVRVQDLGRDTMQVDDRYGPDRVRVAGQEFWTLARNDRHFRELAPCVPLNRGARMERVAMIHYTAPKKTHAAELAHHLLDAIGPGQGGGASQVVAALIRADLAGVESARAEAASLWLEAGEQYALTSEWALALRDDWRIPADLLIGVLDVVVAEATVGHRALTTTYNLRLALQGSPVAGGRPVVAHLARAQAFLQLAEGICSDPDTPTEDTLESVEQAIRTRRHRGADVASTRQLLTDLSTQVELSPSVAAAAALLEAVHTEEPLDDTLQTHRETLDTLRVENQLEQWFEGWHLGDVCGRGILSVLGGDPDALQSTVGLHRTVHESLVDGSAQTAQRVGPDLDFAEHLWLIGEQKEAAAVLEQSLAVLPVDGADLVMKNPRHDPTALNEIEALRVAVLEKLVTIGGDRERPDLEATAELARLQPLNRDRLTQLSEAADGATRHKAQTILALFDRGGLSLAAERSDPSSADGEADAPTVPLSNDALGWVRHPLANVEGYRSWLSMVAAKSAVDIAPMRQFSERVTRQSRPALSDSLSDGFNLLQMRAFPAFISAGELGYGVRAHSDEGGLILIGGKHLTPEDPRHMTPTELRFAVGCELAHVRFAHPRATSDQMRQGAWDLAIGSVKFVGSLALMASGPLAALLARREQTQALLQKFIPLDLAKRLAGEADGRKVWSALNDRAAGWVNQGKHTLEKAEQAVGGVKSASGAVTGLRSGTGEEEVVVQPSVTSLSPAQQELFFMYRVTQLTADRAGLLLCRDLHAAIRAMFLLDEASAAQLPAVERGDLITTLRHQDERGDYHFGWLAVRVASLIQFYLSPEYEELERNQS